jgi:hypothetical protein
LVELTVPVVLSFTPAVVPLTLITIVHELLVATVPPVSDTKPVPPTAVTIPPQLLLSPFGVDTTTPAGSESLNATPVNGTVFATGLVMVKVSVVLPLTGIVATPNALPIDGGDTAPLVATHAENSDVSVNGETAKPSGRTAIGSVTAPAVGISVAVDVITEPPIAEKLTLLKLAEQFASVVTLVDPRNVCPSPLPDGSHAAFEKNSTRKELLAVLFSVPEIMTLPPTREAEVRTGKFWKLFAPPSPSQASFRFTPLGKNPL